MTTTSKEKRDPGGDLIAKFRASGRDCDDIGAALRDTAMEGVKGRLYLDGLWIEDTGKQPPSGRGRWHTTIVQESYESDDLSWIEERLFQFALDEGCFDESGGPS